MMKACKKPLSYGENKHPINLKDQSKFLKENEIITIQLYETNPVSIILPDHVSFKVIEADNGFTAIEMCNQNKVDLKSNTPAIISSDIKTPTRNKQKATETCNTKHHHHELLFAVAFRQIIHRRIG